MFSPSPSPFFSLQVWALLLGIGVDDRDRPWPKVNLFPAAPWQFRRLLARHAESFGGPKEREFVRYKMRRRVRACVSSTAAVSRRLLSDWRQATGTTIRGCYTTLEAGTVLSEPLSPPPPPPVAATSVRPEENLVVWKAGQGGVDEVVGGGACMEPLPGVSTRIVR